MCEQEWTIDSCTRCDSLNEQTVTADEDIIRQTATGEIQIMEVPLPPISDELEQELDKMTWRNTGGRKDMWVTVEDCNCKYKFT